MRKRKCKVCGEWFSPKRAMQPTCGAYDCMVAYAESVARKVARKRKAEEARAIRERREKLKTTSDLAKEAQEWFNRYVRLRDRNQPCISCGRPASWTGQWHASHFKSVGANSFLRFNLWNVHKACSICNHLLSGNIGEYAKRLPDRIGDERFRYLINAPRSRKFDREYLIRLKKIAMKACKRTYVTR